MGRRRSGSEMTLWRMLLRPSLAFRHLLTRDMVDLRFFSILLAGMVLVLVWADLFELGRYFETGRILSGALILGPVIGLLFFPLLGLLGMWLGNALDRTHHATFHSHLHFPPFPLKDLLWRKVLGMEGLRKLFSMPVLRQYMLAWAWCKAAGQWLAASVSGGRTPYNRLLGCITWATWPFYPLALFTWVMGFMLGHPGFGRAEDASPLDGWSLAVKVALVLTFLYLWLQLLREGFALGWMRALIAGTVSTGLSMATVLFMMDFLTGIRWL